MTDTLASNPPMASHLTQSKSQSPYNSFQPWYTTWFNLLQHADKPQGWCLKEAFQVDKVHLQSTFCKMLGWMNHKLESRLLGEISTTSHMHMITL